MSGETQPCEQARYFKSKKCVWKMTGGALQFHHDGGTFSSVLTREEFLVFGFPDIPASEAAHFFESGPCATCGGSVMTDGWRPSYNDPDNAGMHPDAEPCPDCQKHLFPAVPPMSKVVETQTEPSSPKMERGGGLPNLKKLSQSRFCTGPTAITAFSGLHTAVEFRGRRVSIIAPDIETLEAAFEILVPGVDFDPAITQQACVVSPEYLLTERSEG